MDLREGSDGFTIATDVNVNSGLRSPLNSPLASDHEQEEPVANAPPAMILSEARRQRDYFQLQGGRMVDVCVCVNKRVPDRYRVWVQKTDLVLKSLKAAFNTGDISLNVRDSRLCAISSTATWNQLEDEYCPPYFLTDIRDLADDRWSGLLRVTKVIDTKKIHEDTGYVFSLLKRAKNAKSRQYSMFWCFFPEKTRYSKLMEALKDERDDIAPNEEKDD